LLRNQNLCQPDGPNLDDPASKRIYDLEHGMYCHYTGTGRNLVDMLKTYEIDILAIQEMRWIGQNFWKGKTAQCTTAVMIKHIILEQDLL
jgi:hypothetical protein